MASIRQAKQRLLEEMEKLDPKSNEYSTLAARLEQLTKSEQNEKGWMGQLGCGIIQTVISAAASTVNVWNVLKHEDRGNIVTTKSLNYAPNPQNTVTRLRVRGEQKGRCTNRTSAFIFWPNINTAYYRGGELMKGYYEGYSYVGFMPDGKKMRFATEQEYYEAYVAEST